MPRFKLGEFVVWRYKYGADYEFFLEMDAQKRGKVPGWQTPKAITSLPEIDTLFDLPYVNAYYMLDSSRPVGMGLGAIPLSEITNLWDRIELGDEEDFMKIIQGADMAYLKAYHDDPKNKPQK